MESVCIIAGVGEYYGPVMRPGPDDYVIAADGGYLRLREMGVRIDEVIGDFDSAGFVPDHPNTTRLPVEKDDTDMLSALRVGVGRGFRAFHLYGGTGGRLDHTLANIQCLGWLARQGLRGYLHDKSALLTAIHDGALSLSGRAGETVSLFALGERAEGVDIAGLKYAARDITLTCDFPLGVSNEFTGQTARIAVRRGTLLICFPEDAVITGA